MSLTILASLVVVGIALVALIVHVGGGSNAIRLSGEDDARRAFLEDFPDAAINTVFITADKTAAIMLLGGREIGIVQAFGHNYVTRRLTQDELDAFRRSGTAAIEFKPKELTWTASPYYIFSSTKDVDTIASVFQSPGADA